MASGTITNGTVGANINYTSRRGLWHKFMTLMTMKRGEFKRSKRLCYKAGAPASNTAADNPANAQDICIDVTNNHVYVCTTYDPTGSASTWTQIA